MYVCFCSYWSYDECLCVDAQTFIIAPVSQAGSSSSEVERVLQGSLHWPASKVISLHPLRE